MGSIHSKVIESFETSAYDDTEIREYLIDLLNDDPQSFEDHNDDINTNNIRPYGLIRNNRKRSTNLWLSPWGLLITSEGINIPGSYEDKLFRKRFRLPYGLFKKFVKEANALNIFEDKRGSKIAIEFKIMIGLRILGRDNCADDISEYLNIGESTITPIFKQFVKGCVKYLYSKYVYIPDGEELDQVSLVYEKLGLPGCIGSMDCTHVLWHRCPKVIRNNCTGISISYHIYSSIIINTYFNCRKRKQANTSISSCSVTF